MTTIKVWGYAISAIVLGLLGAHIYTSYIAQMPHTVWRLAGTVWASWASWHTFRLFMR
ncbi:hypothetical protein PQR67_08295 [Paraburkholderia fungorum]|uniref:hypothetical protein n=1 Tax=Paraburkholderia fungorum TaxID=134537 RepID=UPI0038B8A663